MSVVGRGVKNAFRNPVRTGSVVLILAISIGLALVMFLASGAVKDRIAAVQSSIGNTINISPAGARGFEGGGEPLTNDQLTAVQAVGHVKEATATLQDRLTSGTDTNLQSAIDAGTLGNRFARKGGNGGTVSFSTNGQSGQTFTLPISVTGISDTTVITKGSSKLTTGAVFDGGNDEQEAVIGTGVATKNNLTTGGTFTAYGQTFTVKGIFDAGNEFANSQIYLPIKTVQRLSDQANQLTSITVTVDSITNLDSTTQAIKDKLGDKADVTNTQDSSKQALAPLENIRSISTSSLIGALVAGAIITLLVMLMIVRERRREIGVLKAIGSSNVGIVTQFVAESLTVTILGGIVGTILGAFLSNPILKALVSSTDSSAPTRGAGFAGGGGFVRIAQVGGGQIQSAVSTLHTSVGFNILGYGLLAAVVIAVVGSAVPAWLIAHVRPAEVLRGE